MKLALAIGMVGVMAWLGLRWFERVNLYFPIRELLATPAQVGMPYEEVTLRTEDGVALHGWWIPLAKNASAPTILFCHGNGGNISHRLDRAKRLLAAGANVFLFDYRGYGQSDGRPSEKGMVRDVEAAYQYLVETRKIPGAQILLYGESLGGAVAVDAATRHAVGGLILDSTFTSAVEMANHYFPWLPARWLMRYPYDSLSKIKKIQAPLLALHSPQDEIVPYALGRKLFDAAPSPKQFFELAGDHNEGYIDTGDAYIRAIGAFLKKTSHNITPKSNAG